MSDWVNVYSTIIQLKIGIFSFFSPNTEKVWLESMGLCYSYVHQEPKYKVYQETTLEGMKQ